MYIDATVRDPNETVIHPVRENSQQKHQFWFDTFQENTTSAYRHMLALTQQIEPAEDAEKSGSFTQSVMADIHTLIDRDSVLDAHDKNLSTTIPALVKDMQAIARRLQQGPNDDGQGISPHQKCALDAQIQKVKTVRNTLLGMPVGRARVENPED